MLVPAFQQVTRLQPPFSSLPKTFPRSVLNVVLSAHSFLIAAIFTTYMGSMGALVAYICRTGSDRPDDPPDTGEEDGRDPESAMLPLAT